VDRVEAYIDQAVEPLEEARIVLRAARSIPNLAQCVDQHLLRINGEIDSGNPQ